MIAVFLCVMIVIEGVLLLIIDFRSFVYQRITVGIGLCWGGFAIVLILLGSVPGLSNWSKCIPQTAVPAFLVIEYFIPFSLFYLCRIVSELQRKNQELAIHVSLLNQEKEELLEIMQKIMDNDQEVGT